MKLSLPRSSAVALIAFSPACGLEESNPPLATYDPSLVAETMLGDWFYCTDLECTTFSEEAYRFTPEGEIYRLRLHGTGRLDGYSVADNMGRYVELSPGEFEFVHWDARTKERRNWKIEGRYGVDHEGYRVARRKGYRSGERSELWVYNACAPLVRAVRAEESCPPEVLEAALDLEARWQCDATSVACIVRNVKEFCSGGTSALDSCMSAAAEPDSELSRWFEYPSELPGTAQGGEPIVPRHLRVVGEWAECNDRDCHTFRGGEASGFSFGTDGHLYKVKEEAGVAIATPERKGRYYVVDDEDGFVSVAFEESYVDERGRTRYSVRFDGFEVSTDPDTGYDLLTGTDPTFSGGTPAQYRRIELGPRRPEETDSRK